MAGSVYQSWGGYPKLDQKGRTLDWRHHPLPEPLPDTENLLPFGNGRSYGDVCLNRGGTLLDTRRLNRFIRFDTETGVLRCESGILLADVLRLAVPAGWFIPVSPGTRYVTVGGALANDVHGKNHHRAGTFGMHVRAFELLRSDGSRHLCVADEPQNADLWRATIGGLGLTGLITWVELQLRPLATPMLAEESLRFGSIDEFFEISDASDQDFEYTVAWVDCLASDSALGRGLFSRANHLESQSAAPKVPRRYRVDNGPGLGLPFTPPFSLVNKVSLRAFNALWYNKQWQEKVSRSTHYQPFFYPLDSIAHWNRMYGPKGMLQYQCVLPRSDGRAMLAEMLKVIAKSGQGSFLAVLKVFGDQRSPGMLSFPRPGVTLALDFPNRPEVFRLLNRLDDMTGEVDGAVYPAKDARMSSENFQAYFPAWRQFANFVDPAFSSSFWRRVTAEL
jgi:FAD/FMN-containing dehydrogenase